jgi:hypothetical protein
MGHPRTQATRLAGLALIVIGVVLVVVAWPRRSSSMPSAEAKVPLWQGRARFGVGAPGNSITRYPVNQLGIGWYLNWQVNAKPSRPSGVEFVQMVRVRQGVLSPDAKTIARTARSVPGSLWLVGNEPDRTIWQDDATPVQYATAYHQAYQAIKQADSTALVAIGGVLQPTPLRLRYLDAVLAVYQDRYGTPMPVDVWNTHNCIVREELGSWGAEIPPGLSNAEVQGVLRQVDDSDNLDIFKSQIRALRQWMRDHGQQNKPLIVSEYGILMPPDYGFGSERVRRFLYGTFDFFLSAQDPALGYPPDQNRLVQRWCWYSLVDTGYPTGNLFDPQTFQMTPLGDAWREYIGRQ